MHTVQPAMTLDDHTVSQYTCKRLTRALAQRHAEQLVAIHNLIPHVTWNCDDLLASQKPDGTPLTLKWQLSYAIMEGRRPVGLLTAYIRPHDALLSFDSIYIHRLAIDKAHQKLGLGTTLLNYALQNYRRQFPRINHYTVQTNDEASNQAVIAFYKKFGFTHYSHVVYPDKIDTLMVLTNHPVTQ